MDNLKWGVIGAGSVAQRRSIPAMQKTEKNELHAILSRDPKRGQLLAERFGAAVSYTDMNDLLADPELDSVYIATPVFLHAQQAIAARRHHPHHPPIRQTNLWLVHWPLSSWRLEPQR